MQFRLFFALFVLIVVFIAGCDLIIEGTTTTTSPKSSLVTTSTTVKTNISRIEEINQKWKSLKPQFIGIDFYETSPGTYSDNKLIAPYVAGKIKSQFLQDALNMTNFVRFLAGLPYDVILDNELINKAQHGSVLLKASGFSHTPSKPADMDETFYNLAYSSTSSSNIAYGYQTIASSIKDGYMSDGDTSNIDRVGHRRWILNPKLLKTGFGYSYGSMTMQVFDQSRTTVFDYDFISWPSNNDFPSDFFKTNDPWSITLNPLKYSQPSKSLVKVTLKSSDKEWTFSQTDTNKSGKYFNVETSGYGVNNCIIFRPDGVTSYTGSFTVEITGIKDKQGIEKSINYSVNFFKLD